MYYIFRVNYQSKRDLLTTARIINNVAVNRMINSRRGISKINELITGDWKNALIVMKIVFIPQKILDRLRFVLDKNNLIRKLGFRDLNFKEYLYIKSIASISVKS
jgi:hypothetical protein